MSPEPERNPELGANWRTRIVIAPWAWLILQAVATVAWLIAIAWGGFQIARWLFG